MKKIIIGAIGFFLFAIPILGGVFNIGSITGLTLFGLLILCGAFPKKYKAVKEKIISKKVGRAFRCMFYVVLSLALITVGTETALIANAALSAPQSSNVTLIVLGCKVNGETPSQMLGERIDAAFEWLSDNPDAVCVLSGGQGEDEGISEALCMYRELTKKGIDESRLFIEDKSTSTKENIAFSKEIIESENLPRSVAVVSNEFHLYRAKLIVKEQGLGFSAVSAKTARQLLPVYLVREWYAVIYQWISLI